MAKVCAECGVPRVLTRSHAWRDGCIVDKSSRAANLAIYETYFHNALLERVGELLEIPLDPIIYDAGRNASERVIRDMFGGHRWQARLAFSVPLYRFFQKVLVDLGKAIGVGDIEILEHKRGKSGKLRLRDPYHLAHCLAVIAGALQVVYGFNIAYEVTEEDGSYLVDLVPSEQKLDEEELSIRLAPADLIPGPTGTEMRFPLCRRCGAPKDLGMLYSFNLDKGLISECLNLERVILIGVYSLNALMREFERELGYDINDLFIRVEKHSFKRKLSLTLLADELRTEKDLREYLALRGLGMLEGMERKGDEETYSVSNAFIAPVVAARLVGLWENKHMEDADFHYSLEGSTLNLSLSPKA